MARGRILTGDRPTGKLHLGHWVGTLQNRVRLQDEYDCFFLVADYHMLTTRVDNLGEIEENVRGLVLDYLAAGIDPERSTIYLQSLAPQVAELHLLFSMITTVPRLQRVPSLKEVMRNLHIETPSYGLLGYPVLQAADIMMVRANLVPVGKDQASHLEITREVARRFNDLFGSVFPEPETLIGDVPTLVGTDGKAKMSKSVNNAIFLSDDAESVQRRVMSMYTDPTRLRATDPGHVRGNPVFAYHDAFNPDRDEVNDLKKRYRAGKVGDVEVKRKLAAALNQFLEPLRERRAHYASRPGLVEEILQAGSERAREEADETLRLAREAMGLNYFRTAGVGAGGWQMIQGQRFQTVPTLTEARRLAGPRRLLPLYREILADAETPVSAYLKVARGAPSFLLESVEGGERLARYSFVGTEPRQRLELKEGVARFSGEGRTTEQNGDDPLALVDAWVGRRETVPVQGLPRFHGGAVGYLSFEMARCYERLPAPEADPLGLPLGLLALYDTLLVFDHLQRTIKVVTHIPLEGDVDLEYARGLGRISTLVQRLRAPLKEGVLTVQGPPLASPSLESNFTREGFEAAVEQAKEHIAAGDVIQVVVAQRFTRRTEATPFAVYRALRAVNPSPYMYFLDWGAFQLVGASPGRLVLVEKGRVTTHPIAGTRPRGATLEADRLLFEELRGDEKEGAEHLMLVDLGRNDVGRVSVPGSVRVPQFMEIERYSHVMHLVSQVTGELRSDLRPVDALRACFPAGTVSGAPKIRAMEIIAELEPERRGYYAGAVGFFGYDGSLETAITIRTMLMQDGVAHIGAGAGIVADSVPSTEYEETRSKARAAQRALDLAEQLVSAVPAGEFPATGDEPREERDHVALGR